MKIAVLTGAGVSAESGISTFRDANGLWEGHDIMEVASPRGWTDNPALVLDFYNKRRAQLASVRPNAAHVAIANLETEHEATVITQNVDDLHERAGSKNIIHLHGELTKARSVADSQLISHIQGDILLGDMASDGQQLRPHIVWFGEAVPMIERAASIVAAADIVVIVGTSMQVYPAAGLVSYAAPGTPMYYIDPRPTISHELSLLPQLRVIEQTAVQGVPPLVAELMKG